MDQTQVVTLNRLLYRLDHNVSTKDDLLRHSSHDRARTAANIDYARTLLLSLEKQASTVRVQSQRQGIQADLQKNRETIKRISATLQEYGAAAADEDSEIDSDEEDSPERSARPNSWAPARQDTNAGLDTMEQPQPLVNAHQAAPELRSRKGVPASALSSMAQTTARESLFAGRKDDASNSSLAGHEAVLTHNRQQQETLTTSLLSLAQQLKQSSQAFNSSLASEKEVLTRAEGGLESSSKGMEAAERRMGALRRMSEGQGWLGRLKLYGMIAALWVACFLIVFVGPKLRF